MIRKPQQGPLQGIRILDLSRLLPGPVGTMMMADMGAEVIKIENPNQPDYVRNFPPFYEVEDENHKKIEISANYIAFNRSKKSVFLDYNTLEGKNTFLELVKTADIVVEQFRPNFLDKLGIGYEQAREANEKIIYVSITGYGQTGKYAQYAGHDLNYMAISGILGLTGNTEPTVAGVQIADIAGGSYMCVIACLSALHARNFTGKGQHVDVAMTDGIMPLLAIPFTQFQATQQAQKRGEMPLSGGLVNYGVYICADEKYIALGALEPKFWIKFCEVFQRTDLMGLAMPQGKDILEKNKRILADFFKTQSQQYWLKASETYDLLISPVHDLQDLASDVHLQEREMIITQNHPQIGDIQSIGIPIKFSETPAKPSWIAPELGEDTAEVLAVIQKSKKIE
jgi:alpha-methylacyl-CoA racemase